MKQLIRRGAWVAVLGVLALGVGAALAQPGAQDSASASADSAALAALRPAISLRYPAVRWVDAPTVRGWLRAHRDVVLLDAREPAEYRLSHLAGAVRVDPDDPDIGALRGSEEACVVVYCSVGWRSAIIADRLQRAGFSDVRNLAGGIFDWANRGYPVSRAGRAVRAVHPYDETWGRMLRPELRAYGP